MNTQSTLIFPPEKRHKLASGPDYDSGTAQVVSFLSLTHPSRENQELCPLIDSVEKASSIISLSTLNDHFVRKFIIKYGLWFESIDGRGKSWKLGH
jgi:hypothetical protein